MTPQSAKAKGRRLQQTVRDELLLAFPSLSDRDIRSTGMGQTGADIQLSTKAAGIIPYEIECKAVEKLNLWDAWKQAESNSAEREPALVVARNRQEPLAVIRLAELIRLLKLAEDLP